MEIDCESIKATLRSFADGCDFNAVSKESLLYNLRGPNQPNTADDVAWSLHYLKQAQSAGLPVFAIEYLDDPALRAEALDRLTALGMVPFFGRRLLDTLPRS